MTIRPASAVKTNRSQMGSEPDNPLRPGLNDREIVVRKPIAAGVKSPPFNRLTSGSGQGGKPELSAAVQRDTADIGGAPSASQTIFNDQRLKARTGLNQQAGVCGRDNAAVRHQRRLSDLGLDGGILLRRNVSAQHLHGGWTSGRPVSAAQDGPALLGLGPYPPVRVQMHGMHVVRWQPIGDGEIRGDLLWKPADLHVRHVSDREIGHRECGKDYPDRDDWYSLILQVHSSSRFPGDYHSWHLLQPAESRQRRPHRRTAHHHPPHRQTTRNPTLNTF